MAGERWGPEGMKLMESPGQGIGPQWEQQEGPKGFRRGTQSGGSLRGVVLGALNARSSLYFAIS